MDNEFSSELLQEIEAISSQPNEKPEELEVIAKKVNYHIIPGLRSGSELLWAYDEEQLYYKNSSSKKGEEIGYKK